MNTDIHLLDKDYWHINNTDVFDETIANILEMIVDIIDRVASIAGCNRYSTGTDFTEVSRANAYTLGVILSNMGYNQGHEEPDGWQMNYSTICVHYDSRFPSLAITGTGITGEVYLRGYDICLKDDDIQTLHHFKIDKDKIKELIASKVPLTDKRIYTEAIICE